MLTSNRLKQKEEGKQKETERRQPDEASFAREISGICVTRWVSKALVWTGTGCSDLMSVRCVFLFSGVRALRWETDGRMTLALWLEGQKPILMPQDETSWTHSTQTWNTDTKHTHTHAGDICLQGGQKGRRRKSKRSFPSKPAGVSVVQEGRSEEHVILLLLCSPVHSLLMSPHYRPLLHTADYCGPKRHYPSPHPLPPLPSEAGGDVSRGQSHEWTAADGPPASATTKAHGWVQAGRPGEGARGLAWVRGSEWRPVTGAVCHERDGTVICSGRVQFIWPLCPMFYHTDTVILTHIVLRLELSLHSWTIKKK